MSTPTENSTPALGAVLRVLSDSRRRELCFALAATDTRNGEWDPLELVDGAADGKETEIELFHVHLPALATEGFIEWNRERGTISKGSNWESLASVVDVLDENREELPDAWL